MTYLSARLRPARPAGRVGSGQHHHTYWPAMPVVAMPLTIWRWKIMKMTSSGAAAMTA